MWWPFRSKKEEEPAKVSEEVLARLQRRCVMTRRAWESCVQANKWEADPEAPCERLAVRHMECLTEVVAPEAAAEFQKCTSATGTRALMHGNECNQQAAAMASSLEKLQLYPFSIQPRRKPKKKRRKKPATPPPATDGE
ncbi:hypothetical protein WJX74_006680 [Apatococcus lobatus]|uniref:IMS import disulfide relay-system CHCH-CHCH-like Cx9C domain-containing protein n=1 Tax=Apatococcus lobatus TaxID=904363 RepID=A0AAW1QJB4_9CHLO